ncbi:MAG: hypothetical protein ABJB61_11205 [bacterium]
MDFCVNARGTELAQPKACLNYHYRYLSRHPLIRHPPQVMQRRQGTQR